MQTIIETAGRLIRKLNEIQPSVSVCGLDEEADTIREMKADLRTMIGSLSPDHATLGRVLWSCRADAVSHALALREVLGWDADPSEMTDDQVLVAIVAAESFVVRARSYLGSKAKCYTTQGGQHVTA